MFCFVLTSWLPSARCYSSGKLLSSACTMLFKDTNCHLLSQSVLSLTFLLHFLLLVTACFSHALDTIPRQDLESLLSPLTPPLPLSLARLYVRPVPENALPHKVLTLALILFLCIFVSEVLSTSKLLTIKANVPVNL